jgi:hypothetical protein
MRIIISLLLLFLSFACAAPQKETISSLETAIREELRQTQGDFALAFKNLDQPEQTIRVSMKSLN